MTILINNLNYSKNKKIVFFFGTKDFEFKKVLEKGPDLFLPKSKLIYGEQVHQDKIKFVHSQEFRKKINFVGGVDSLITDLPNLLLMVKTADCFPVIFYNEESKVIAIVHAGREGVRKNIVGKTIRKIEKMNLSITKAIIGVGIDWKNYEVDKITFDKFVEETKIKQKEHFLDLRKVIFKQIEKSGIRKENIEIIEGSTFNNKNYFSYRRNKTDKRQIALVGIVNE